MKGAFFTLSALAYTTNGAPLVCLTRYGPRAQAADKGTQR